MNRIHRQLTSPGHSAKPPADWLVPSDAWAWRQVARIAAIFGVAFAATPWLVAYASPVWLLVTFPVIGIGIYKFTFILHDTVHFTLFESRDRNRAVGSVVAMLLGTSFERFQREHWHHHRSFGESDDPQRRDYLGLKNATRARLVWHLAMPIFGLLILSEAAQTLLTRESDEARRAGSSAEAEPGDSTDSARLAQLVRIGLLQLGLAAVATGFGLVWWLFPLYPLAAATVALWLAQVRGFCEHIAPPDTPDERCVRTHSPNLFDRLVFYDLCFNFHIEHHLHPQVPSVHLPRVFESLESEHDESTLSPSLLATIRRRLAEAA